MSTFIDLLRRAVRVALPVVIVAAPLLGRADTVASLLGDFTINQYCGVSVAPDAVGVHLAIVYGQLPALRELHQADANGDGVTTQEERDAYVSRLAPGLAEQLKLSVDGANLPLHAVRWTSSLPKEQNGFSLRIDIDYAATLARSSATRNLRFANQNYAGRIGWHEISVQAADGLAVFDTDAFADSLTGGLTEALRSLPASGPLDERVVEMRVTSATLPAGARVIATRGGTSPTTAAGPLPSGADAGWLPTQTRRLVALISAPHVPLHLAVLALLAAILLGAMHALSPGHGKAIVGAYLIGSRGTARHAAFLGLTVTVTHTLVVFALGLATLLASRFVMPERLLPALSLISGLLVLGMGLVLLRQRWPAALAAWSQARAPATAMRGGSGLALATASAGHHHPVMHRHAHGHDHVHVHGHGDHGDAHGHSHEYGHDHGHDHSHGRAHDHGHDHAHAHLSAEPDLLVHSHGGRSHSHLPPGTSGEAVTWRGLLALGISGGLLPCPSAMVLLLAAVALNKTLFGLALVLAFSLGLAATLTAVGVAFLYARERLRGRLGSARWMTVVPALSAAAVTVLGAVLCYGTLAAGVA
jgi:ABC-type nickel/cobalt efflux system permease component RcnA